MANYFSFEDGAYQHVPTPMPMSLEMYVTSGKTLAEEYHSLRESMEKQKSFEGDAYYKALYSHLPERKPATKVQVSSESDKSKSEPAAKGLAETALTQTPKSNSTASLDKMPKLESGQKFTGVRGVDHIRRAGTHIN